MLKGELLWIVEQFPILASSCLEALSVLQEELSINRDLVLRYFDKLIALDVEHSAPDDGQLRPASLGRTDAADGLLALLLLFAARVAVALLDLLLQLLHGEAFLWLHNLFKL